ATRRLTGTRFWAAGEPAIPDDFAEAMDDDIGVPQALAVLHETVTAGNAAIDSDELSAAASALGAVTAMTDVLGINPDAEPWTRTSDAAHETILTRLVEALIDQRQTARTERDFATAD